MNFCRRVGSRYRWFALVCAFTIASPGARSQAVVANASQQMVFAGLRSIAAQGQINALGTDAAGDVYLAFDQGDGVRVLKVANDGRALLAQVQLGVAGDSAVALALDPNGNVYIAGTSTSGSLSATAGAAVGSASAGTTNSFVAKFDANLNEIFLTFTGGTRIAASAVAASGDRVFVTGITYGTDLPVSATGIQQAPAIGSLQNGFVESFSADGTTLEYATYITGAQGDTTPTGIAVDAGDDAWLVGSTTASGFPTIAAVVPEMLSTPSGFLLQLTPAGDGIVYSTFVPGTGLSSIALDTTGLNLLISGQVALGQFPVDTVTSPLVPTPYQVLLRMSSDGSTVMSGTVIAPGLQSEVTAASGGAAWVGGTFAPGVAPLLPQPAISTIGNGYAVRVTPTVGVDETIRFGGLATADQSFASVPVALNGVAVDGTGALFTGGSAQPTASSSLLSSETYDFPLLGGPTAALPSVIADAELTSSTCGGSLCAGSAGYLAKVDPVDAGPSLAFSADGVPAVTLRNLGSATAQGLQLTTSAGTLTTNCGSSLPPASECDLLLAGGGAGSLTASTSNGGGAFVAFNSYSAGAALSGLAFAPKELDFGIQTASSSTALKTILVSNLGSTSVTFSEGIIGTPESSTPFTEVSSTCPLANESAQKVLAAGATCTITVGFSALPGASNDGFIQGEWTIGSGDVLLTGYSQAANLSVSASEIDFGTEYQDGLALPRYLFLSNSSTSAQPHATVSAPANSPFTVTDGCPGTLEPATVCRLRIDYLSNTAPSADSLTLTLDGGLSISVTGQTMPPQTVVGSTVTTSLTVSTASVAFANAVVVTGVSSETQTVSLSNTGTTLVTLSIGVSGDFADVSGCGTTLAAGASCAVAITFTPSQPGVRQGLLTVSAGSGTSPLTVDLSGTGAGILSAPNGTLTFASTPVGQPLVQAYKISQPFGSLTVQTTGPYLITLVEDAGFGYGNPPISAYASSGSGSCYNCWVVIRFQPTSAGQQAGTLSLSSVPNGLPYQLQLLGVGTGTSGLILSPSVNNFGTVPIYSVSGATVFTLTNLEPSGSAVTVSTITTSGSFAVAPNPGGSAGCSGELVYAASCTVLVQFAPTTIGADSGSLTITTSADVASASLTGTGTTDLGIAIAPLALTFAQGSGAAGATQSVSVQNTGTQPVAVGMPTTTTTSFSAVSGCGTLAPGATCSIQVSFTASATQVTDVLSIPVTIASSGGTQLTQTYSVSLTGNATLQSQGLTVLPSTVAFGPVASGLVGPSRTVTLTNLTSNAVNVSVSMPRSYELQGDACTSLGPNASCNITIAFVPLENGDLQGTISVTAAATDGSSTYTNLIYTDGFGVGTGTLTITGGLIVDGVFNFGSIAVGQSASQQFALTNGGTQAITVRRVITQPPFNATTSCGGLITPGSSCTATVQYSPGSAGSGSSTSSSLGTDMGTLTVESDAQSSPNILDLQGQPSGGSGTTGGAVVSSFSLSQGSLSFGATTVGDTSASQNLLLTNTGTATLQVSSVSTTPAFQVQNGCSTVTAGSSCTIAVASSPQNAGTIVAGLEITSNASDSLEYVTLVGTGVSSPLLFSPASLSFGSVLVGESSTLPVQVTNSGSSAITFSSITAGAAFAATGTCPTGGGALAAQATCTEQVTFAPTAAGAASGVIAFNTSASTGAIPLPVSGTGIQPELRVSPASLSFGSVPVGTSVSLTVTLTNQGSAPIAGLSLSITGDFTVAVPCTSTTLAGGANCSIELAFTPTTTGTRAGVLTLVSSDPSSPLAVQLNGTGTASPAFTLTADGGVSATTTVTSGTLGSFSLVLTPTGSFVGGVVLTCAPVQPVAYASCSLLPPQVTLGPGAQNSTATINTEQSSAGANLIREKPYSSARTFVALVLPGVLLMFRRGRNLKRWIGQGLTLVALLVVLQLTGCGGKGSGTIGTATGQNYTSPGQYQFEVTATSSSGTALTQSVTLNLVVTAR